MTSCMKSPRKHFGSMHSVLTLFPPPALFLQIELATVVSSLVSNEKNLRRLARSHPWRCAKGLFLLICCVAVQIGMQMECVRIDLHHVDLLACFQLLI